MSVRKESSSLGMVKYVTMLVASAVLKMAEIFITWHVPTRFFVYYLTCISGYKFNNITENKNVPRVTSFRMIKYRNLR